MVENIVLDRFPKEAGVYWITSNDEVIYVGSSKSLYKRMTNHRRCIRQGSAHGYKKDLYQYLQSNQFTVEFQLTDDYRQLEQALVEKYNPRYNSQRAFTGLGAYKGRVAEYNKEWYHKYKEEKKQYYESNKEDIKQYYESNKEEKKQYQKQYNNQLCYFNGQTLTLNTLSMRLRKAGISKPTKEAKKYLIRSSNND